MNDLFTLKHLSGSTINAFIERKHQFFASKIERKPFKTNPNMCRGKAVEEIVNQWVNGREFSSNAELQQEALLQYDKEMLEYVEITPSYIKEEDVIRTTVTDLAALAYNTYRTEIFPIHKPTSQKKIYYRYDGIDMDVVGILDYHIPNKFVRDCKVVAKSAKKLSQGYCITGAVYKAATGDDMIYDLFVANKKVIHCPLKMTDEEFKFGLSYGAAAAKVLIELRNCEDPVRLSQLWCFPDLDAVWDKTEKKELADRWGIYLPKVESNEE